MKLIVGLGNPGKRYENTRHNAGFMAVDYLAGQFEFDGFKKSDKHNAEIAEGRIGDEKTLLIKPQTFMNLSGMAVRSVMQFYKIPVEDLIVIYDEAELPSGTLRVRPKGSAGGHNGMKSIIQEVGTDEFVRIRIGIAPVAEFKGDLESYVLGQLSDEESSLMGDVLRNIPALLDVLMKEGVEEVMQKFN